MALVIMIFFVCALVFVGHATGYFESSDSTRLGRLPIPMKWACAFLSAGFGAVSLAIWIATRHQTKEILLRSDSLIVPISLVHEKPVTIRYDDITSLKIPFGQQILKITHSGDTRSFIPEPVLPKGMTVRELKALIEARLPS